MTDLSLSNQAFATKPAPPKEATAFRLPTQWIGVAPFFIFALMFLIMPVICVYYPVSVLPGWLQWIAWGLPPTYVFEGMRALLIDHVFRADLMVWSLGINVVLLAASFAIFLALLRSAKHHGSLLGGGE